MSIVIREIKSKKDLGRFIKFPWKVYDGDPNWIPPLIIDIKTRLNPAKNPYFKHSEAKCFIAEKNGDIIGRIAATVNNNHNKTHDEKTGFFSFFECFDDQETANSLFDAAAEYLRNKGLDTMRGPANFSSNDDWAMLVEGFDKPPLLMMTYNPEYYIRLAENYGFKKKMDLLAYYMTKDEITERLIRTAELIRKRTKITIRTLDMKNFWDEVDKIMEVYNSAWLKNWGFVPMTKEEIKHLAKDLKMIVNPEIFLIAEADGKPVGFSMALPDANQAIKLADGRLFPFGIIKMMRELKKIKTLRVLSMGVIPEYRNRGIDAVFYYETFKRGTKCGFDSGEFSWILETNEMMNRAAQNMGAKIYKTYRIFDYKL